MSREEAESTIGLNLKKRILLMKEMMDDESWSLAKSLRGDVETLEQFIDKFVPDFFNFPVTHSVMLKLKFLKVVFAQIESQRLIGCSGLGGLTNYVRDFF